MANTSNYALRLQSSILEELRVVVKEEGTTLNQFINVAVAEKLAAIRTERYFQEHAKSGSKASFLAILEKAGSDERIEGDELPQPTLRSR